MRHKQFISKSQYLRGLQCLKRFYLYKFHPELKDEVSDEAASAFDRGTDVGTIAQSLFPNGIEISFDGLSFDQQMAKTTEEMISRRSAIYEATFLNEGLYARVDILSKSFYGWIINEVKSSTSAKDVHYEDLAFQYHVLDSLGIPLSGATIIHLNSQYVKQGDLDIRQLFTINDVTPDIINMQPGVVDAVSKMRTALAGPVPDLDIGAHCSSPYECEFIGHCWKHVPEVSVFNLRGRGVDAYGNYKKGRIKLEELPLHELPEDAQMQITSYINKSVLVDKEAIREFLKGLWYPVAFLDFETFMSAVPLFENTRPYEQMPFQYSLHVQEFKGGPLKHSSYLAEPNLDPRRPLVEKLTSEIPPGACVVAYNVKFERNVLFNLAEMFPEHEAKISDITNNMIDFMYPFWSRAYYSWKMKGSYSLKSVIPALVPELSYDGLRIADGSMAMDAYLQMCQTSDMKDIEIIRNGLLEYCHLDTLALVKVLEKLYKLTSCNRQKKEH